MTKSDNFSKDLLLITDEKKMDSERRDFKSIKNKINEVISIELDEFKEKVDTFIKQMDYVMEASQKKVGAYQLDTIEISASAVIHGKGELGLALFAKSEVGAQFNPSIKFIFKNSGL